MERHETNELARIKEELLNLQLTYELVSKLFDEKVKSLRNQQEHVLIGLRRRIPRVWAIVGTCDSDTQQSVPIGQFTTDKLAMDHLQSLGFAQQCSFGTIR